MKVGFGNSWYHEVSSSYMLIQKLEIEIEKYLSGKKWIINVTVWRVHVNDANDTYGHFFPFPICQLTFFLHRKKNADIC